MWARSEDSRWQSTKEKVWSPAPAIAERYHMVERYRGRGFGSNKPPAKGTHKVGYGSPPLHTRYPPGQSGNPRGKPSGVLNLKTDLIKELNRFITVRTGDGTVRIKKGKAWITKIVNGALSNDAKATATLVQLILRFDLMGQTQAGGEAPPLTTNDDELLADWLQRQLGNLGNEAAQARSAPSDDSPKNSQRPA
jgi:hypothetical protein